MSPLLPSSLILLLRLLGNCIVNQKVLSEHGVNKEKRPFRHVVPKLWESDKIFVTHNSSYLSGNGIGLVFSASVSHSFGHCWVNTFCPFEYHISLMHIHSSWHILSGSGLASLTKPKSWYPSVGLRSALFLSFTCWLADVPGWPPAISYHCKAIVILCNTQKALYTSGAGRNHKDYLCPFRFTDEEIYLSNSLKFY